MLFTPVVSKEELADKNSWINTGYTYPMNAYLFFYANLGECLAAWAMIESRLYAIYIFSLKTAEPDAATNMFFSTPGFRAKLDMTNSIVMNAKNTVQDIEIWQKLREKLIKKSARRNLIAHGTVFYQHTIPKEERRFYLSTQDYINHESKKLYMTDLVSIRDSFISLNDEMTKYHLTIRNRDA